MSVEFDTPANRVILQFKPQDDFKVNPTLPDLGFLRQLSIQGRLRTFSGSTGDSQGTETILLNVIPDNGQTLFIYSCRISNTGSGIAFNVKWGDEVRLTVSLTGVNGLATAIYTQPYFDSFAGNGIKAFKIGYTTNVAGSKATTVLGWVENTSRIRDVTN